MYRARPFRQHDSGIGVEQVKHLTDVDPCYSSVVYVLGDWKKQEKWRGKSEEIADANRMGMTCVLP